MIQEKIHADMESINEQMLKKMKMNGLVQADDNMSTKIDSTMASIPVSLNRDGSFSKDLLLPQGSSLMRWERMCGERSVTSGNRSWMEMRQWNPMNLEKECLHILSVSYCVRLRQEDTGI